MIFLVLMSISCGNPPEEKTLEESFSEDVSSSEVHSLKAAREDLNKAKQDVKCIKSFIKDQKLQQAGEVSPQWEQPSISEYESNDCKCLAPLLR